MSLKSIKVEAMKHIQNPDSQTLTSLRPKQK